MEFITKFGAACGGGGFFSIPTWYKYLPAEGSNTTSCVPKLSSISDLWLVVAAIIDILLRVAALGAVVFIIYGGILFITSEGQSDKVAKAIKTIMNAAIGLVIAIASAAIVSFIAGRFN